METKTHCEKSNMHTKINKQMTKYNNHKLEESRVSNLHTVNQSFENGINMLKIV